MTALTAAEASHITNVTSQSVRLQLSSVGGGGDLGRSVPARWIQERQACAHTWPATPTPASNAGGVTERDDEVRHPLALTTSRAAASLRTQPDASPWRHPRRGIIALPDRPRS
ncbi:hypothetical protein GCM10022230_02230 [Pseudoclavibacter caeni]